MKPVIWHRGEEWYCSNMSITEDACGFGDTPIEAYYKWIQLGGKP